ncbi:MAG: hypothetical protein IAE78_13555 [Myxococcus sp.]|nr:hypothetical protein [Myxococcus sp.]
MRLFGKDVTTQKLLEVAKERLGARGLLPPSEDSGLADGVEPPVDAFAFAIEAMAEHVDVTRGLPIETHRDGLAGQAVVLAKRAFRRVGQLFINEALARQVVFNGHALDGYATLGAEVAKLREQVAGLEAALTKAQAPAAKAPVLKAPSAPKAPAEKPKRPRRPRTPPR